MIVDGRQAVLVVVGSGPFAKNLEAGDWLDGTVKVDKPLLFRLLQDPNGQIVASAGPAMFVDDAVHGAPNACVRPEAGSHAAESNTIDLRALLGGAVEGDENGVGPDDLQPVLHEGGFGIERHGFGARSGGQAAAGFGERERVGRAEAELLDEVPAVGLA